MHLAVALVVASNLLIAGSWNQSKGLAPTVNEFLELWLVKRDFEKAATYFGPDAFSADPYDQIIRYNLGEVPVNHANLLKVIAPRAATDAAGIREIIQSPSSEYIEGLRDEAKAKLLNDPWTEPYLIFTAYPGAKSQMTGGWYDLELHLLSLPKRYRILLVGLDFVDHTDPHYDGSLVLFWMKKGSTWQLVGIGAFPV